MQHGVRSADGTAPQHDAEGEPGLVGRVVLLPVVAVGPVFLGVLFRSHDVHHVHGHLDHVEAGHVLEVAADNLFDVVEDLRGGLAVLHDHVEVDLRVRVVDDIGVHALCLVCAAQAFLDAGENGRASCRERVSDVV